jgi:hypothetical protein
MGSPSVACVIPTAGKAKNNSPANIRPEHRTWHEREVGLITVIVIVVRNMAVKLYPGIDINV